MLWYLGRYLQDAFDFGPARLLQSYAVLISVSLYLGFVCSVKLLPKFYNLLPHDRGREFALASTSEAAKGKPTGAGVVFISFFVLVCLLCVPMSGLELAAVAFTWLTMLSGFLDDRSVTSWGEYLKGALDLILSAGFTAIMYFFLAKFSEDGRVCFWFPFVTNPVAIPFWLYMIVGTVLLWTSINTTNCTDGVDGLSSTLILVALMALGIIFYVILGHVNIASYLLVPHLKTGAAWGIMTFAMAGTLMGYLWHNAFPSSVLMGDAGSRALGFFIGACVLATGNPFILIATSLVILLNGGTGLIKVALLRFFKIKIFSNVRFPLHDHVRKNLGWSPTQVLLKFLIVQLLVTIFTLGIFFKIR